MQTIKNIITNIFYKKEYRQNIYLTKVLLVLQSILVLLAFYFDTFDMTPFWIFFGSIKVIGVLTIFFLLLNLFYLYSWFATAFPRYKYLGLKPFFVRFKDNPFLFLDYTSPISWIIMFFVPFGFFLISFISQFCI